MEANELFTVRWKDPDGHWHKEQEEITAMNAVMLAHAMTQRPAAVVLKVIREIRISDTDNFCVFLWRNGEGVVFPQPEQHGARVRGDH